VIPVMLKVKRGSIIHIASPTGLVGCAPAYTAYSASKAVLFGLTRVMAAGYGRDNIRINAIVPGVTDTPLIAGLLSDPGDAFLSRRAITTGPDRQARGSRGIGSIPRLGRVAILHRWILHVGWRSNGRLGEARPSPQIAWLLGAGRSAATTEACSGVVLQGPREQGRKASS
jgi:NAD(P)-dependent dehydrogenase (short-subunit alcohol dehydrogenase family)